MLIKQAIPCIMHLENCSGEKILTMLVVIGAERYQLRRLGAFLDDYVMHVELIVRTQILGMQWRPKQWRVPMKESGDEIGKISLSNSTTREFTTSVVPLVDFIFQHPEDIELKTAWHEMISCYNAAIELLR